MAADTKTTDNNSAATDTAVSLPKTISELNGTQLGGRSDWGNKLVVNTGTHPVINFAFMLRIEGVFDLPCKSIKGIRRENEFDYIQEGGLNDYVHLKRKPLSKPCTFQVERYVGVNWVDPMPLGTELVLPVILFVNKYCFPTLKPVRTYAFTGCTVIAKDYGELNAEASGLLVETVTIAYREMVCLDIPSETLESDTWQFDGKKREGKGTRKYNSNLLNKEWETSYNSKAEMEKAAEANRYKHTQTAKDEKAKHMAKHITGEQSKAEMEQKADEHQWKPEVDQAGNQVIKSKYGNDYQQYVTDYNAEIDKKIAEATDVAEQKRLTAMKKVMGSATSRQYTHSKDNPKNYSSAKHHSTELSQSKMEQKADEHQWKPEVDKDGNQVIKSKYGNDYKQYVTDYNAEIDKKIKAATDTNEQKRLKAQKKAMGGSASRQYSHSKETPKNYSSAKHHEAELSKTEMETAAAEHIWDPATNSDPKYGNDYERFVSDYNAEIDSKIKTATDTDEKNKLEAQKKAMGGSASRQYSISKEKPKNYSSAKHVENELSKDEMQQKATLYQHEKTAKRKGAATYNENELSKDEMLKKVTLYQHEKTAKRDGAATYNEIELSQSEMQKKATLYRHGNTAKRDGAATYNENELSKNEMQKKATLYQHTKKAKRDGAATYNEKELSMKEMAGKARLWPKTKSAKQITDFLKKH